MRDIPPVHNPSHFLSPGCDSLPELLAGTLFEHYSAYVRFRSLARNTRNNARNAAWRGRREDDYLERFGARFILLKNILAGALAMKMNPCGGSV
jgi:hypothetical protein